MLCIGSIDSDMARHDLIPTCGHLDGACFNSMTVLNLVRTEDFNFHSLCSKTLRKPLLQDPPQRGAMRCRTLATQIT
jgi:hypothetical protein